MLFLVLRVLHIITGVFWAGTIFFVVSFLLPSFLSIGPAAGPVQAELGRRGLFAKLPIIALVTIISGLWMYSMRMGPGWAETHEAKILGTGGLLAIVAFLIGVFIGRPNQAKAMALGAQANGMAAGPEKDALMAQSVAHRTKFVMAMRMVATLIGVTVLAMAGARYL